MTLVKSPLRYPGGKAKAVKKILSSCPSFKEYREPFLGGGSLFLALKQNNPNSIFKINDLNNDLMSFWNSLKTNPLELITRIIHIKDYEKDGKKLYLFLRRNYRDNILDRAVRYYILNRITYSGLVDSGGYSKEAFDGRFTYSKIEELYSVSNLLKDVEITTASYEDLLKLDGDDVFIYLDPPYLNSIKSRLYGKRGVLHLSFNHEKFAKNVKQCKHKWLITYDDTEEIRDLFSFAYIYPLKLQYGMDNNGKTPKIGNEIIITNYLPVNLHLKKYDGSYT